MTVRGLAALVLAGLLVTGCGSDDGASTVTSVATEVTASVSPSVNEAAPDATTEQRFPDVIAATAEFSDPGWNFTATVSSPYDTPERYADAWRVVSPDGDVLGVRELTHDHAAEQPFTRSLSGIEIPDSVDEVTVEARDLVNGWGGATVTVELERP